MIEKRAETLEGGDVVFRADGTPAGVVLDDPYIYDGYPGVEFTVQYDDQVEHVHAHKNDIVRVRPWRGSGAV